MTPSNPQTTGQTEATTFNGRTFDARDWAREFVGIARENPEIATDEGTMLGWFANALMRGYDEHAHRFPAPPVRGSGEPPRTSDMSSAIDRFIVAVRHAVDGADSREGMLLGIDDAAIGLRRAFAAARSLSETPPAPTCTDLFARWCPIHGDCTDKGPRAEPSWSDHCSDRDCPLHGAGSQHARSVQRDASGEIPDVPTVQAIDRITRKWARASFDETILTPLDEIEAERGDFRPATLHARRNRGVQSMSGDAFALRVGAAVLTGKVSIRYSKKNQGYVVVDETQGDAIFERRIADAFRELLENPTAEVKTP